MKYLIIILRFIKGYVVFRAEKGFTERFINLCGRNGIFLWDISVDNGVLTACISLNNYLRIRSIAKKSGIKISIERKVGLVFKYRKYNKRIGFLTGFLFFVVFHLVMNCFVWCVDVKGNINIPKEEIVITAEKEGLCHGTFKKSFDEVRAARKIASKYNGKIPWLSINIKGSMAIIELREENNPIKETESDTPCNIIADFDGIMLSVETFRGDLQVMTGNAVKEGDLLISGVIDNEDLSYDYYRAKGNLTAIRSKKISLNEECAGYKKLKNERTIKNIGFLGIEFPYNTSKENYLRYRRFLKINGYELPFYVSECIFTNTEKNNPESDLMCLNAYEKINMEKYNQNKNSTILAKKENITTKNNRISFNSTYETIDFIGKEIEILSEG